jgi:PIN domain nuclease of toxin-antitoxin system
MATISDLILDTHIIIWLAIDPDKIALPMLEAIEKAGKRIVSHVTVLEIQLKHLKGPEEFPFSLEHLAKAAKEFSCSELAISYQDIKKLGEMRFLHADPFDRLLMAQAANRDLILATADSSILTTSKRHKEFRVIEGKSS